METRKEDQHDLKQSRPVGRALQVTVLASIAALLLLGALYHHNNLTGLDSGHQHQHRVRVEQAAITDSGSSSSSSSSSGSNRSPVATSNSRNSRSIRSTSTSSDSSISNSGSRSSNSGSRSSNSGSSSSNSGSSSSNSGSNSGSSSSNSISSSSNSISSSSNQWRPNTSKSSTKAPRPVMSFEEKFKQVCSKPKLPMPVFEGLASFLEYLTSPPDEGYCYSWLRFGGERNLGYVVSQLGEPCADGVRDTKFLCLNKEYRISEDPCLVYSFSVPQEDQFEKDMQLFSCEVHSMVSYKGHIYEHTKRSKFWYEHDIKLSMKPRDRTFMEKTSSDYTPFGRFLDYKTHRHRTLQDIVDTLGHQGRTIKFAKSDVIKTEWTLLQQIVQYQDDIDVQQMGVSLFLGRPDNTPSYQLLYKIFQSLACSGYRLVKVRPVQQYMQTLFVEETNTTYYPAYHVNFVKDLSL